MAKRNILLSILVGLVLVIIVVWFVNIQTTQTVFSSIRETSNIQDRETEETTLMAVGDIMLDRKVGRLIEQYGIEYPLANTKDFLKRTDLTFANLESPIGNHGEPLPGKGITFRAKPDTIDVLLQGGFDVVSLANNHMLDYDTPALLDTMEILKNANIDYVGAGVDINQARRPHIKEVNGLKIGFLAYTEMADLYFSQAYPRAFRATETLPGVAPLYEDIILEDIQKLREQVDIVVVSLHWGIEYVSKPAKSQKNLAYKMVDAGADLILGHHPHILQGLEIYQNGLIAYSLGNFIFDQNWATYTKEGLALEIKFNKLGIESARIWPVHIIESQPKIVTDSYGAKILKHTKDLCADLGTDMQIDDVLMVGEIKPLPGPINDL